MISSRTALREDGAHLRPDKTESVFLINTLENDMSTNELCQLIAHLPVGPRYGISTEVIELECIELMPVPQVPEEAVSTEGCEVHELAAEVVIRDYPASRAWLECNPLWTGTGIANKEKANGHVAS